MEFVLRALMCRFAETQDPADAQAVAEELQRVLRSPPVRDNEGLRSYYDGKLRLWHFLAEGERGEGTLKGNGRCRNKRK